VGCTVYKRKKLTSGNENTLDNSFDLWTFSTGSLQAPSHLFLDKVPFTPMPVVASTLDKFGQIISD